MRRVVVAALPRELRLLTRGWREVRVGRAGVSVWVAGETVAACGGMGGERAAVAVEAALGCVEGPVEEVISFGLAGACAGSVRAGEAMWCGTVVEARSGERFGAGEPVLVTGMGVASVAEKRRLRESYGAALVDMEAATVARVAGAREIGFRALKGVSDGAETAMEGMERYVTGMGAFRERAFALHVALRPSMWRVAMELGRASGAALRRGTAMLREAMAAETGLEER